MNNSIIAVDIIPANAGEVLMYGAPDKDSTYKVQGKIRIVLSRPLKCKQVIIKLKGRAEYSDWINQYAAINLLRLVQVLSEKSTLPRGVTDIDYEFIINGNLPQTYLTSYGSIRYKLVAVVQPSSKLLKDAQTEKSINFARYYLPCQRDLLPSPPTKIYRGQQKNLLKYELQIPTIVGTNEKGMLVHVRLLPLCGRGKVREIMFDLVQYEKYKVQPTQKDLEEFGIGSAQLVGHVELNDTESTKLNYSQPIKPTSLLIFNEEDVWDNPLTYNLPFVQHTNSRLKATIKSPLMRIKHEFRIMISFENEHEEPLELIYPIIFTSIPNDESGELTKDGDLPSYDDVINVPSGDETDADSLSSDSAPNSLPSSYVSSRDDSGTNTPITCSDPFPIPIDNNDILRPSLLPNVSRSLHHRRSCGGGLAQTLGRLLLCTDTGFRPTPISAPSSLGNVGNPTIHVTSSATDLSEPCIYSHTRSSRPSLCLNLIDEEDQPIMGPEIHSAPSSPRGSINEAQFSRLLSGSANRSRYSMSLSHDTSSAATESTRTSAGLGEMLRRASFSLRPNIRVSALTKRTKKSNSEDPSGTTNDGEQDGNADTLISG